jgi:hypothetical protein
MARSCLSRFSFAALCALVLLGLSLRSNGYVLEHKSWPKGTVLTMQVELGALNQSLADGSSSWNEAVAPAIDDWNAEMENLQIAKVMNSSLPISSGDGVNSTSFSDNVFGESFGAGVLAVSYYSYQGGTFLETDVLFNNAQIFDSYRGDLKFNAQGKCICDIRRVYLHELGHSLGLNHPDTAGQHVDAIMNSVVSDLAKLTEDDEAGIHFLYGAPGTNPTPTPSPPGTSSRLVNLSTRMQVGLTDEVLIGGFIIQGDQLKKVVLRAIGPSLAASGVSGALQDPQLELHDASGALLESNDNWQDSLAASEIAADQLAPSDPRESAIVTRLGPGNYTAIVSGVNNTTGIALVENYTLDTSATHAANISTRGRIGAGDGALIGGFIVGGESSKNILIRGLGPSLGAAGISGAVANPLIELHDGTGQIVSSNDNWNTGGQASEIMATGIPPDDPRESALIATVAPGAYTAVMRGAGGGEGLALIEIYDLDP